jgi:hypothetical protein
MSKTFQAASDALAELFGRSGMKRRLKRAEAVILWPQVVGDVARFSEAKRLQDGVLVVEVADSETAMHLSHQRHRFIDAYQRRFGVSELKDIRFRVGKPQAPPAPAPAPPKAAPDPKALASMAKHINDQLPDSLAGPALQAAKAMLRTQAARAAQGAPHCDICGVITQQDAVSTPNTSHKQVALCRACRRYLEHPVVTRASRAIAVNPDRPTPELSDDERLAALWQAERLLRERIDALVPHVLAEPDQRVVLETAVRCYLALHLKKPFAEVTETDFAQLEPRLQRLLGIL